MNRFTLCTVANYKGRLFNLPFNMNTFYRMWGTVTPDEARRKIEEQRREQELTHEPRNLEEQAISLVGKDIYETLIKGYTEKQWGRKCSELPAFIIRRLPVRYTFDNNYFNDRYQGVPEGGYNRLIEGLLKGTECSTGCDYLNDREYWNSQAEKVVYTGAIDEYFDYQLGRLEYRSLRFEHEVKEVQNYQGNAIINYTSSEIPFTRIVEHKHFDINNLHVQQLPVTVITREYPMTGAGLEPYYPVNDERNNQLYRQYRELAGHEHHVILGGRLATYRYMDMDEVMESAMKKVKG
jgi:UDP-galactopyranose mutase